MVGQGVLRECRVQILHKGGKSGSGAGNQDFLALISSRIMAATTGFRISRVTACSISGLILASTFATSVSMSCCDASAIFTALSGFFTADFVTLSSAYVVDWRMLSTVSGDIEPSEIKSGSGLCATTSFCTNSGSGT